MEENEKIFSGKITFLDGKRTFFDETKEENREKEPVIQKSEKEPVIQKSEKEPVIQKSEHDGSFRSLVKEGDEVESGKIIGYLRTHSPTTGKEEIITIIAKAKGIVAKISPKEKSKEDKSWMPVECDQELFIITPTS